MDTKISALLDGELDIREAREVCVALRHDAKLRRLSGIYALIGDALRHEPMLSSDISGAVMTRLSNEPVILAPGAVAAPPSRPESWLRPALAMAATIAGVAVIGWLGLPSPGEKSAQQLAQEAESKKIPQQIVLATATDADMQEFLIAHQLHGGSYLVGESQRIRTVSLPGAASN